MALVVIDELGLLGLAVKPDARQSYLQAVRTVIKEWAEGGNIVIVGRAGQALLCDFPRCVHVRVVAPLQTRLERVMDEQKISAEAARAQIEASDRYRKNYLKRFYQVNWNDPELYDLVINTGRRSIEEAAKVICSMV